MLEESSMEKKNANRTASGPSRTTGADAKGKQDVVSNKFSRSGRRRESPCSLRSDQTHKPFPQRGKGFDKRPKPRGLQCSDRDRSDIAESPHAEIGSVLHKGSKKLNLNHLLNFTYTPRVANSHLSSWGNSWRNRNKWSTKKHKYNKEQFLQANCQFVVKAGGDYSIHSVDPDPLVDWDAVELIRIPGHEVASCPICLYEPVAAKITRCGHIYCWACILHYLALTDKTWRKCPICFEAIHKKDLKSVTSLSTHPFAIGETITMKLMQRIKGSVFAMAKCQWKDCQGEFLHLEEANDGTCFSKLLIASPEQVSELVLKRERIELENAFAAEKDCPESCFIESALEILAEREKHLLELKASTSEEIKDDVMFENDEVIFETQLPNGKKTIVYSSAFSDEEVMENDTNDAKETNSISDRATGKVETERKSPLPNHLARQRYESMSTDSTNGGDVTIEDLDFNNLTLDDNMEEKNSNHTYYFYQAADGQHIYMHALNIRMLIKQYGNLENCPDTVVARIVEKEDVSMNEDLRKRLRYLGHLPLTCEFEIVELNLKSPIVLAETTDFFRDELEKRRRRRNKRARDERKRENFIREEENRKWGRFPGAHLNLMSHRQFPEYRGIEENEVSIDACNIPLAVSSDLSSSPDGVLIPDPFVNPVEERGHSSCPSFAQMLREGKAKCEARPPSPLTAISEGNKKDDKNNGENDPEDYVPVPEYHLSFGNAIQEALKRAPDIADSNDGTGKKKKKKSKPTLLFTTSMARNK